MYKKIVLFYCLLPSTVYLILFIRLFSKLIAKGLFKIVKEFFFPTSIEKLVAYLNLGYFSILFEKITFYTT